MEKEDCSCRYCENAILKKNKTDIYCSRKERTMMKDSARVRKSCPLFEFYGKDVYNIKDIV